MAKFKKDTQMNYRQILDEQIKHKELLSKQGTMTQLEKSINKGDVQNYKQSEQRPNAMVPGMFSESPLRNIVQEKNLRSLP